jgi:DNA-binding transcriptional LysR family regulator
MVSRATRDNSLVVVSAPQYDVDLPEATWLLREPGSGTRATMVALHASLGIDPPTLSLGSHGAVIASAVLGLGVTLASADAVAWYLAEGELVQRQAAGTPMSRPWHLITTSQPTATTRLFVDHLTTGVPEELAFVLPRRRRRSG